ncbi:MAG: hypothetical protein KJO22_11255, partial [Bacteroidia bacterium]|nr:hypothetical protein [Bacteroidia bacterium]
WGYEKMSYFLPKYGPFINQEDISLLFKNNTKDFFSSYSIAVRKNIYRIVRNDYNFTDEIGGYNPIQLSKIEKLNQTHLKNNFGPDNPTLSTKNINYLRKMIDFLRLNDVNVFLIRSPQHISNPDLANEKLFKKVYSSKFSDVEFLDFNNLSIKNEHYLDFKHLNYFGAIEFSNLFNNLLKQGLLKSKNKQESINNAIEEFNYESL